MNPAAGWYADPVTPNIVRYWDGTSWTEHTAPSQPPSAPHESQQRAYGEPVIAAASPKATNPAYGSVDSDDSRASDYEPTYAPMRSHASYPTAQPQPHYVVAVPPKNDKATRALVWGIVSIFINPFALPSILAIVFGLQARGVAENMEKAGLANSGRGQATGGIVVGIVGAAIFVVWLVFFLNRT